MAQTPRDLSRPELWATSIERSLERRRRPRRSSVELWALREPRDLTDVHVVSDSLRHALARRSAAERAAGLPPGAVRGLSLLGLLAVTATPTAAAVGASDGSGTGSSTPSLPDPEAVGSLQSQLGVPTDGRFGARTDLAVRRFQANHGLSSDGVVGPATRAALGIGAGPPLRESGAGAGARAASATAAAPPARAGGPPGASVGVGALQTHLGLAADGDFGPITVAAVRAYQRQHGLGVDGVVGPATRAALGLGAGPQLVESPRFMPIAAGPAASAGRRAATAAGPRAVAGVAGGDGGDAATRHAPPGGSGVRALQAGLGLSSDGDFGPRTLAAVQAFQRAHGLTPDGVVGPSTRAALGLGAGPVLRAAITPAPTAPAPAGAAPASGSPRGAPAPTSASSSSVDQMSAAADRIASTPYVYGGGHGSFTSSGYDCSGSVSYVLHAAGLLSSPEDSSSLESYGQPGPGRYVTIYANAGHAWMTIGGRRFDTSGLSQRGSRWSSSPGDPSGYTVRHPDGM